MILKSDVLYSIQKELGSFFSTEAHSNMDYYRYINSAIEYIYNFRDWEFNKKVFSFNYEAPNTESTLPIFCLKTFHVKNGTKPMTILDNEAWFILEDHTDCVGIFGNMFIAEETGTYSILHTPAPATVDATSKYVNLPDNFKRVVEELSIMFGYQDLKLYDKAAEKKGSAEGSMNRISQRATNPRPNRQVRI